MLQIAGDQKFKSSVIDNFDLTLRVICITFVTVIFASAIINRIGMYADGSYFLFKILITHRILDFDTSRRFAQILGQIPLVFGIDAGVKNITILTYLSSLGLVGVPAACWLAAISLHFRDGLFWIFLIAFSVAYLLSGFFAIGEYNIAFGLSALCASILTRDYLTTFGAGFLLALAFLLTLTYESNVFICPLLFGLAGLRIAADNSASPVTRILIAASAFCFAAAAIISGFIILFPRSAVNLHDALDMSKVIHEYRFEYTAFMLCAAILIAPLPSWRFLTIAAISISIIATCAWFSSRAGDYPSLSYNSRSIAAFLLFVSLAWAAWVTGARAANIGLATGTSLAAPLSVALLVGLGVPFIYDAIGFGRWLSVFEQMAAEAPSFVAIDNLQEYHDPEFFKYSWGWTNPALSLILRGHGKGLILNSSGSQIPDLDIAKLKKDPLAIYRQN